MGLANGHMASGIYTTVHTAAHVILGNLSVLLLSFLVPLNTHQYKFMQTMEDYFHDELLSHSDHPSGLLPLSILSCSLRSRTYSEHALCYRNSHIV